MEDPDRLATLLRSATRAEHARAEGTTFVGDLVEGRLDVGAWTDLLRQLHGVYLAMETAAEHVRTDPGGSTLVIAALTRVPSIEHDLDRLAPAWRSEPVLPEAQDYASRVAAVGTTVPGYVAHAYTRYLGDLSGGIVIRNALRRAHGLDDDALTFFRFDVGPPKLFKDDYRARLDALPLDDAGRAAVVAEARHAFDLNTALLTALGRRHPVGALTTAAAPGA